MDDVGPTRDVDDRVDEGFVEGHRGVTEAGDPALVTEGLAQGIAEHDGDVLDRVVRVDVDVARGPHPQVDE